MRYFKYTVPIEDFTEEMKRKVIRYNLGDEGLWEEIYAADVFLHGAYVVEINDEIRCNNCLWEGSEDELKTFTDLSDDGISHDVNYIKGCPNCGVDDYLTNLKS